MNGPTLMSFQVQAPSTTDDSTMMSSKNESSAAMDDSTMEDSTVMSSSTESTAADSNTTGADRAEAIANVLGHDIGSYTPVQKLKLAQVFDMLANDGWTSEKHVFKLSSDEQNAVKQRILQLAWPLSVQDPNTPLVLFRLTQLLNYHCMKAEDFTPVLTARAVDAFNDVTAAGWEWRINHQLSPNSGQKERFKQTILKSVCESMFETDLAESLGEMSMK